MKNLLDDDARTHILSRLDHLEDERPALWGRMNVNQMVCHLGDQFRIALGQIRPADCSGLLSRTALKWMVLAGAPAPKGKVATFPEIDQVGGKGTKPESLARDVATLKSLVQDFLGQDRAGHTFSPSPAFGKLTNRQWGRLAYVHMDHHLRQFGA